MEKLNDNITLILKRAFDIIFTKYPARTGLGVVLGCVLVFLTQLFKPALNSITFADFAGAPWWGWMAIGILVMHSPTIVQLFQQRPVGDEEIDKALDLINLANFSPTERRQQFRNLIDRVSSNLVLNQQAKSKVKQIEDSISLKK